MSLRDMFQPENTQVNMNDVKLGRLRSHMRHENSVDNMRAEAGDELKAREAAPKQVASTEKAAPKAAARPVNKTKHRHTHKAHGPNRAGMRKEESNAITFGNNSAELSKASGKKLDQLAARLQEQHVNSVDLTGFADGTGAKGHNDVLAQQRLDTMKAELAMRGIETAEMTNNGSSVSPTNADPSSRKVQIMPHIERKGTDWSKVPGVKTAPTMDC